MQVITESDLLTLFIAAAVLVFVLVNYKQLDHLKFRNYLFVSFFFLVLGYILSIVEELLWKELLNFLQHSCFSVAAFFVAIWGWLEFHKKEDVPDV